MVFCQLQVGENVTNNPEVGKIGWIDLTIDDADAVRDFYKAVVGWEVSAFSLGDYDDYCVAPPADAENPVAGICHRRGPNANVPSQWLMYVTVANLKESMAAAESNGGKVICPERDMGSHGTMCVVQDPAGAVCAIIQPASSSA